LRRFGIKAHEQEAPREKDVRQPDDQGNEQRPADAAR
jgi:hypothetical protein